MTLGLTAERKRSIRTSALESLASLPARIERYEIRGELGRGGMGIVYDAVDPDLQRSVAIKVMSDPQATHLEDGLFNDPRFEREMQAASPVFHPNVVTIFDAGTTQIEGQNVRFYVMERIEGESLEEKIRRSGPIEPHEIFEIMRGILNGLEALHRQGIVHRDVKPSNVLLPINGPPQVSDFGLVRVMNAADSNDEDGLIVGSMHGLAPEQILSGRVDTRADLFALGALAIRMWTGEEPFAAENLLARFRRIETDSPSGLDSIPDEWHPLLEALLEKSPEDRPKDAGSVRTALEAIQQASARPNRQRHTLVAALGILAVLGAFATHEWTTSRTEAALRVEHERHRTVLATQLERAALLATLTLSQAHEVALPADERRASADRLEGVANRIAFERRRHARAVEALDPRTLPLLQREWPNPTETKKTQDTGASSLQFHHITQTLPRISSSPVDAAALDKQLILFESETGVPVQIHFGELHANQMGGTLPELAQARAPALGVQLILDPASASGELHVSHALEAILPDAFVGALLREQILPFVRRGETAFGIRLTLRILRDRLNNALRGETGVFDELGPRGPREYAGGGARATLSDGRQGDVAGLNSPLSAFNSDFDRERFAAAPTVEIALARFVEWLNEETLDVEIGVLSPASREILRDWPATRPYWRFLRQESRRQNRLSVLERGDAALLSSLDDPELPPAFFKRGPTGWQVDLAANRTHLIAIAGGPRRWSFRNVDTQPLAHFQDRLGVEAGLIRWAAN